MPAFTDKNIKLIKELVDAAWRSGTVNTREKADELIALENKVKESLKEIPDVEKHS